MKYIILIFLAFNMSTTYGQLVDEELYAKDGVSISTAVIDCNNPQSGFNKKYLVIELENETSETVKISFKKEMWYANVCQTCTSNSDEYKVIVEVAPNTVVKGGCDAQNASLRIFIKMLNIEKVRQLSKYELKNIQVESIK